MSLLCKKWVNDNFQKLSTDPKIKTKLLNIDYNGCHDTDFVYQTSYHLLYLVVFLNYAKLNSYKIFKVMQTLLILCVVSLSRNT